MLEQEKAPSATFFFKEEKFKAAVGFLSVTATSAEHLQTISGINFQFIDTPGFGDKISVDNDRVAELGEALLYARDGVHAIAICINSRNRFTGTDGGLYSELKILGKCLDHAFVVCTHGEVLGPTEQSQNANLTATLSDERCPPKMKELFSSVKNRYMIIESLNENGKYYQQKLFELQNLVERIHSENQGECYTNELFKRMKYQYDETLRSLKQTLTTYEKENQARSKTIEKMKAKEMK